MAGDLGLRERLMILPEGGAARSPEASLSANGGRIMHVYGDRVMIAEMPPGAEQPVAQTLGRATIIGEAGGATQEATGSLSEAEALGVDAFALRQSAKYKQAKANRPRSGENWDSTAGGEPLRCAEVADMQEHAAAADAEAGAPTSSRLTGKVAVAIVIVEGPTAALKFSAAERTKVVAEVQNGLGWLGAQNPAGAVQFVYEIRNPKLTTTPLPGNPDLATKEARWRDPAMATLGYAAGIGNVTKYANDLRTKYSTNWAYVAFFTKYPLGHFAYASIGGPRLVMDYANDGWGPDNIDRVFAHETGHVFNAPDEYAASGCNTGGSWGHYGKPNSNCANGAPGGGVACIMKANDWEMCNVTPYHLGFPLADQRYSGVFAAGAGQYGLWVNASYASFINKWTQWGQQGLRLHDLEIVQVGNERRYNGVWRAGGGGYGLWVNADWNSFVAKWSQWSGQGLRLVDLDIARSGNTNLYSGVFLAGNEAYGLWANTTWASFVAKWQQWSAQGLRLVDLKITNFNGERRYSGVFRAGNDGYGLWVNATWNDFKAKWQQWASQGLRLVDLEVTDFGGQRRYSGVFRAAGAAGYGLWVNADWPNFKAKWEQWSAQGLRLVDFEVTDPGATAQALQIPGALAAAVDLGPPEGDGGLFIGVPAGGMGDDIDTGEAHRVVASTDGSEEFELAEGGLGGTGPASADTPEAHSMPGLGQFSGMGAVMSDASPNGNGFGAVGGSGEGQSGAEDGLGGLGGGAGSEGNDLDTGALVGSFG